MVDLDRTRASRADEVSHHARRAVDWLLNVEAADSKDPSLYFGQAGVVLALHEAAEHFDDDDLRRAASAGADALVEEVERLEDCSLYFGLAGVAGALRSLGRAEAAARALDRIRERFDGERWNDRFELLVGNAGIGLGALWAGEVDLAVTAVTPYLAAADPTAHGVNWAVRPTLSRSHHIAHGTLGVAYALAAVGQAADREDFIELALAGAADVVSRDETTRGGFLVPHSDPQHRPELVERYSLGWCNGPAGDAQVFRLLAQVTGDSAWTELGDRCWREITGSGLPARVRPGFWDNNGRCCGTAGVLALACDRIVERGDDFDFADVLVEDLVERATVDDTGVRWSNVEHRVAPPNLEPVSGWAMGNAGIVRELLRYLRLTDAGSGRYAVQWPDQPTALSGR